MVAGAVGGETGENGGQRKQTSTFKVWRPNVLGGDYS